MKKINHFGQLVGVAPYIMSFQNGHLFFLLYLLFFFLFFLLIIQSVEKYSATDGGFKLLNAC